MAVFTLQALLKWQFEKKSTAALSDDNDQSVTRFTSHGSDYHPDVEPKVVYVIEIGSSEIKRYRVPFFVQSMLMLIFVCVFNLRTAKHPYIWI